MKIRNSIIAILRFYACWGQGASFKMLEKLSGQKQHILAKNLEVLIRKKQINLIENIDLPHNPDKDKIIQKYIPKIKSLPGVYQIAVCNSVSLKTNTDNSDIDLFIVLKSRLFFVSRAIISIYLHLLKLRRHGNKIQNRFCLSFFVSEKNLEMKKVAIENDIYLYYWTLGLNWHQAQDFPAKFLSKNHDWLKSFGYKSSKKSKNKIRISYTKLEKILTILEPLAQKLQLNRAHKKNQKLGNPKGVIIQNGLLKFHVIDKRQAIKELWEKLT